MLFINDRYLFTLMQLFLAESFNIKNVVVFTSIGVAISIGIIAVIITVAVVICTKRQKAIY